MQLGEGRQVKIEGFKSSISLGEVQWRTSEPFQALTNILPILRAGGGQQFKNKPIKRLLLVSKEVVA